MPSLRNGQLNYSGKSLGSFSLVSHLKILEEVADLFKVEEIELFYKLLRRLGLKSVGESAPAAVVSENLE